MMRVTPATAAPRRFHRSPALHKLLLLSVLAASTVATYTGPSSGFTSFTAGDLPKYASALDDSVLDGGDPYKTRIGGGASSGAPLVVVDVPAPPKAVWDAITGTSHHPTFGAAAPGGDAKSIRILGTARAVHVKWTSVRPLRGSLGWTLNRGAAPSGVDDYVGAWHVVKHTARRGWSRVYVSVRISVAPWAPRAVPERLGTSASESVALEAAELVPRAAVAKGDEGNTETSGGTEAEGPGDEGHESEAPGFRYILVVTVIVLTLANFVNCLFT